MTRERNELYSMLMKYNGCHSSFRINYNMLLFLREFGVDNGRS